MIEHNLANASPGIQEEKATDMENIAHHAESTSWKQGARLLPHALACLQQVGDIDGYLAFASLAYKVAQYLREHGRHTEAKPLYQRALHVRERALGLNHSDVAQSLNGLANLYWAQGKYTEAEAFYQRALHIWEQQLGPEHLDVAYPLSVFLPSRNVSCSLFRSAAIAVAGRSRSVNCDSRHNLATLAA